MKRWIIFLALVFFAANLTGCDAVQRKFTRKRKEVKTPRFYQLKKYPKKPSPELYKQHFAYWRSWQEELIEFLGQNHKKDVRAVEEATGQLKDLQDLLIPSKAEEMEPHIESMQSARDIIFRGDLNFANKDYVRRIIEKEDRSIKRWFCYEKVKNSLRTGAEEEQSPKLTVIGGKEVPGEPQK